MSANFLRHGTTATRQTADERREAVLEAANVEFALRGLHGASTDAIARRAGISQPYLFRLFGSKKELFLAVDRRLLRGARSRRSARPPPGKSGRGGARRDGRGLRRCSIDEDPHDAAGPAAVLRGLRRGRRHPRGDARAATAELVDYVETRLGRRPAHGRAFFAKGMLHERARGDAVLDRRRADEPWADRLGRGLQGGRIMKALLFFSTMVSNQSLDRTVRHEEVTMKAGTRTLWTFAITSIALFMVVLDNLVVSTALPVIRVDLGASIEELEWTVNAYTLTFAVFLLTGAALGDRFGRKRMFMIGVGIFTAASARGRARAVDRLAHRRPRRAGRRRRDRHAADADDPQRGRARREARCSRSARGRASPASPSRWARSSAAPSSRASRGSGSSGSTCPSGSSCSRSRRMLRETHGPDKALDLPGLALGERRPARASSGASIHGNGDGWTSP